VTETYTISRSSTFTEARVRNVMLEVGADFYALAAPGLISLATAMKWTEELTFILLHQAAQGFQIQLRCEGYWPIALDYRVSADGSILESGTAGGIDYFALAPGTTAMLFVDLNFSARNIAIVRTYLNGRSWGTNGEAIKGVTVRDRAYAKDGYGVIRSKIGTWP
jgi:hypothetical protein